MKIRYGLFCAFFTGSLLLAACASSSNDQETVAAAAEKFCGCLQGDPSGPEIAQCMDDVEAAFPDQDFSGSFGDEVIAHAEENCAAFKDPEAM